MYSTGQLFGLAGFLLSMTHIQHLEDLLLTDGTEAVEKVMADINAGKYEVSIKYDGAPAVVFGTDADGTFIATKGYFNKKPKKFYTHDEILASSKDHALIVKLTAAFSAIRSCHIPEGNIYWGDLMYWDGCSESFQPNVVRYYHGDYNKEVGIAVHTQLAGNEVYTQRVSRQIWTPQTWLYEETLPEWKGEIGTGYEELLSEMKRLAGEDFWTRFVNSRIKETGSADLDFTMAWVYLTERHVAGKLPTDKYRELDKYLRPELMPTFNKLSASFHALSEWKIKAYKELNLQAQMIQTAVIGQEFWHEGFVVKTPSATIKIVDRERFSVANFALWAKS